MNLTRKIEEASHFYDIFYTTVYDAFWHFEVDVDFDQELRAAALDGLVYTTIKIIRENRGVEAALATLDNAKSDLIV